MFKFENSKMYNVKIYIAYRSVKGNTMQVSKHHGNTTNYVHQLTVCDLYIHCCQNNSASSINNFASI